MKKHLAWILGGTTVGLFGAGATMFGCSSTPAGNDAGMDVTTQDVANDVNNMDTGTMDAGPDVTCKIPSLHPGAAGTIFCGYDDAGNSFSCGGDGGGQQCCLGGPIGGGQYAPEICATFGGACNNPPSDAGGKGLPIECGQTSDCTANNVNGVCCLQGGASAPAPISGCPSTDLKSSGGTGIKCEVGAACAGGGDLQICESNAECGDAGKVCTPFHWKLYQLGFCM
jgi:hypothetical protein